MVDAAEIYIWGQQVGAVLWDPSQQLASFEFEKNFIRNGWDLAPIMMPIGNGSRIYRFPELRSTSGVDTFKGLPGLLADMLPDKYGNQLIDAWLARNGRISGSMNPIETLCFIGSRGMGALEFRPAHFKGSTDASVVEVSGLVNIAQKILSKRGQLEANVHDEESEAMQQLITIGTSAGGARPKAVVAYNPTTGVVRSGQTAAPAGFEHWLLKLDGVSDAQFGETHGFGNVEYAYHLMAADSGIEMMPCRLLKENGRSHFMTQRFDRDGANTKHHIQTLCAMRHYDYNDLYAYSYEQLFQVMRALRLKYPEAEQMFRRMVFNLMATNCDDHTKNVAFRLKKNSEWELAPAYDVCYSYDPSNIWVNQHTLSINGKHRDLSKPDLLAVAKQCNVKNAAQIIDQIQSVVREWPAYSRKASVPSDLESLILENLAAFTIN